MTFSVREKFFLSGLFFGAVALSGVALNDGLMQDSQLAEHTIAKEVRAEGRKLMDKRYGFAGNGAVQKMLGHVQVYEKYVNVDKRESCTVNGSGQFFFGKVINVRVEKPTCQPL